MNPTKNDIPVEKRNLLVILLNELLAELIDLQLQAKQAHWNVKGATFIALHELFDAVAGHVLEFVDTVAERIVALGGTAEGTVNAVTKRSRLPEYSLTIGAGVDHLHSLSTALAAVGKSVRSSIGRSTEIGDADTADILTEISRELDKKLWVVEAHLNNAS